MFSFIKDTNLILEFFFFSLCFHDQPQLILLTVTGMFKEKQVSSVNHPLRSFQRSLVIVPSGSGFCIRNEMLHITNVTQAQEKNAFKAPLITTTTTSVPAPIVASSSVVPDIGSNDETTRRLQMIQTMSAHSNMNLEWSKK